MGSDPPIDVRQARSYDLGAVAYRSDRLHYVAARGFRYMGFGKGCEFLCRRDVA